MKHPRSRRPSTRADPALPPPRAIDALYGLDPVYEPGREPRQTLGTAAAFHSIHCPYCGERFDTLVDVSTGAAAYIEDCRICCQPIEFEPQVDSQGMVTGVSVRRS